MPGGEVSGPVGVRVAGVGEEIVRFRSVLHLMPVHGLQVARGCGVEQVEFAAVLLSRVHVEDELVQVLVPNTSVNIVKVLAHGHQHVGRAVDPAPVLNS